MSRLSRFALVVTVALAAQSALAEAPRLVVFRIGGEGLPGGFADNVEQGVRGLLDADARVRLVSREETLAGIATGHEVGVACGAADVECYRKLAVLVEAQQVLLLRLVPRQGGVVLELARADVASGQELRRVARRLLTDAPTEALLARAVEDALADGPTPSRVAILPFDDGGTGVLAEVEAAARRDVQARSDVTLADAEAVSAALAKSDNCEGMKPSCLAAVGARAGVDKVLYGALREGEGRPTAGIHLLDVVALTHRSTIGDVDGLLQDVPASVSHLLDEEGPPSRVAIAASPASGSETGALVMASAGGALLVLAGASAATGLLFGGGGPAKAEGSPDGARAAVTLAVPVLAVGGGLVAGSLLWLGSTFVE